MKDSFVFCVLFLFVAISTIASSRPRFCGKYDCPWFDSITYPTHQVRTYTENANWVSHNVSGESENVHDLIQAAFKNLYAYIGGENDRQTKVEIGVPYLYRAYPGKRYNNLTISIFLGGDSQKNPPNPTNERVFIESTPQFDVSVRPFTVQGLLTHKMIDYKLIMHQIALDLVKADWCPGVFAIAQYSAPFRVTNRYHETWIPVSTDEIKKAGLVRPKDVISYSSPKDKEFDASEDEINELDLLAERYPFLSDENEQHTTAHYPPPTGKHTSDNIHPSSHPKKSDTSRVHSTHTTNSRHHNERNENNAPSSIGSRVRDVFNWMERVHDDVRRRFRTH